VRHLPGGARELRPAVPPRGARDVRDEGGRRGRFDAQGEVLEDVPQGLGILGRLEPLGHALREGQGRKVLADREEETPLRRRVEMHRFRSGAGVHITCGEKGHARGAPKKRMRPREESEIERLRRMDREAHVRKAMEAGLSREAAERHADEELADRDDGHP